MLKTARSYLHSSGQIVRTYGQTDRLTDRRTDSRSYYSGLHCEQCGRAVKNFIERWISPSLNPTCTVLTVSSRMSVTLCDVMRTTLAMDRCLTCSRALRTVDLTSSSSSFHAATCTLGFRASSSINRTPANDRRIPLSALLAKVFAT